MAEAFSANMTSTTKEMEMDAPTVDLSALPDAEQYDQSGPYYDSPLYTEINIPLPPLPGTPVTATPTSPPTPESKSRRRGQSLYSLSPFHRRRSSSLSDRIPEERPVQREQRIELSMRAVSRGRKKRSGTVGAAIVPAVMVLGAELFTPGQGDREKNIDTKDRLAVVK